MTWQPHHVRIRLSEAMAIQRRIVARLGPNVPRSAWPAMLRTRAEIEEVEADAPDLGATTVVPTRAELGLLERVEVWLSAYLSRPACEAAGLVPDTGYVVGARAIGYSYAKIGRHRKTRAGFPVNALPRDIRLPGGNSRPALVAIETKGLAHVAARLNKAGVSLDPDLTQSAG